MSIYEKILNLPLFKGLSTEALERFVTKTPISFYKCKEGDLIAQPGLRCDSVRFVLGGNIRTEKVVMDGTLSVIEYLGEGSMLGADRLYGIDTHYAEKVIAAENCSIMEFSKKYFINLLREDQLILINYLNYLSKEAQKNLFFLKDCDIKSKINKLKFILTALTVKNALKVNIFTNSLPLFEFLGYDNNKEFISSIGVLLGKGVIDVLGDNQIQINSRREVLDFVES